VGAILLIVVIAGISLSVREQTISPRKQYQTCDCLGSL